MMLPQNIHEILAKEMPDAKIDVTGDGHHFEAVIVSELFQGKSLIQRQRLVYQILNPWIASGELHAISMKTHTPEEYEK